MRPERILLAGVLLLVISACGGYGAGFPAPPRNQPVVSPVTISPVGHPAGHAGRGMTTKRPSVSSTRGAGR
jgi:hypothetical protein